jgi:hypothetical protein
MGGRAAGVSQPVPARHACAHVWSGLRARRALRGLLCGYVGELCSRETSAQRLVQRIRVAGPKGKDHPKQEDVAKVDRRRPKGKGAQSPLLHGRGPG